jgi:hypothetical protein
VLTALRRQARKLEESTMSPMYISGLVLVGMSTAAIADEVLMGKNGDQAVPIQLSEDQMDTVHAGTDQSQNNNNDCILLCNNNNQQNRSGANNGGDFIGVGDISLSVGLL